MKQLILDRLIAISQDLLTWVCVVTIILAFLGLNNVLIFFMLLVLLAPDKLHAGFKELTKKIGEAVA